MRKSCVSFLCITILGAALPESLKATGGFTPDRWIDNGGIASDMSPEFYWELELKRMARDFTPPEKRVLPPPPPAAEPGKPAPEDHFIDRIDAADFEDAIKSGRIKPPDVDKAKAAHQTMRVVLARGTDMPEEFPSEFADYHRGAFAFHNGATHYEEARNVWEALLKRPENERHYRSVWAAFMLGKLALTANDPSAVNWFRQTRELARAGFADSLGLAADSYGWEAKSELKQEHFEAAAKLYLTQLALGDESAVVSLKAVIPDRPPVGGTLNFGEQPPDSSSDEEIKKWEQDHAPQLQKRLDECARSPVLRHLETAHVLATETQEEYWSYGRGYGDADTDNAPKAGARCLRWLATLEKAGLQQIDYADHIGWVAYTAGRYKEAARWLAMAQPATPTALWLKAKLQRREGKLGPATASMAAAFKAIQADVPAFGNSDFTYGERGYSPDQSAAGDLAGLHLARAEFVNAMDAFLQGKLWEDAAFVGDRILTVDELKKYVNAHFPQPTTDAQGQEVPPQDDPTRMRWMLARRLVREHRFAEARPYFRKKEQGTLDRYTAALGEAENSQLPKLRRARAYFKAAWIARTYGLEIMGTEVEPDGFSDEGSFPPAHTDTERLESVRWRTVYDEKKQEDVPRKTPVKLSIPATAAEKQRLIANAPHPTQRFHYRWTAAELAWKAAALISDGTEELADVLNTGGSWIKNQDDKGADKFIQAIERRCPNTEIGQAESVKHWFVGQTGPWSDALEKEEAADQ